MNNNVKNGDYVWLFYYTLWSEKNYKDMAGVNSVITIKEVIVSNSVTKNKTCKLGGIRWKHEHINTRTPVKKGKSIESTYCIAIKEPKYDWKKLSIQQVDMVLEQQGQECIDKIKNLIQESKDSLVVKHNLPKDITTFELKDRR